jgi:hypothetical protein
MTTERTNRLDKFDGISKDIRIQTWLRLYETHIGNEDADRIKGLLYNLKGIALEWYGDEIAGTSITRWETVKEKIVKRFGISTATPLIDAQRRRLKRDETVEDYFREKMRLLRQTKLSSLEMTQQLTEGLPFQWKLSLAAARPVDPNSWVEVAQQIETHYSSQQSRQQFNKFRQNNDRRRSSQTNTTARTLTATTNRPPYPCNICKRLGRDEYHWHRECPNNTRLSQPQRRQNQTQHQSRQPQRQSSDQSEEVNTVEPLN